MTYTESHEQAKADYIAHTNDFLVIRSSYKIGHYARMDVRTGKEHGCFATKEEAATF